MKMIKMVGRGLAFALGLIVAGAARGEGATNLVSKVRDWVGVRAFADVESAYWARGKIVDARPYSAQFADVDLKLGVFGRVGAQAWSVSSLSRGGQSATRRNAYNEVDWNLHYEYDWTFAEGWALENRVARQWVTLPGYFPDCKTTLEWHVAQALRNPYLTPYYLLRHATAPERWNYWEVGAFRSFALAKDLSLTAKLFGDLGDADHFRAQYGPRIDHPQARYHGGLMALNLVLRLDYALTENWGLFTYVQQFDLVDSDARDAVKASSAPEAKRDLTIFGVGMGLAF